MSTSSPIIKEKKRKKKTTIMFYREVLLQSIQLLTAHLSNPRV